MEGPILPGGSGGKEPPEEPTQLALWDERARLQQERKMSGFEKVLDKFIQKVRKRRKLFNDYTRANCEEAYGERAR